MAKRNGKKLEDLINIDVLKKVIGITFLFAGLGVILVASIRGVRGYNDGLLNFTEEEYIASVDSMQIDFLPLIEPEVIDVSTTSTPTPTPDIEIDATPTELPEVIVTLQPTEEIVDQIPINIQITNIGLNSMIITAGKTELIIDDVKYSSWESPEYVVGWQDTSAQLGRIGNTVLIGHHNSFGSVFKNLKDLEVGEIILLTSNNQVFNYVVKEIMILPEKGQNLDTRLENAKWLWPTTDERLTLVTCWPKYDNSHRLIVVALPVDG